MRNKVIFRLIKVFVILFSNFCAYGQEIIRIGSENGLPQNVVFAITQDANGFIWILTEDGLCRYDGYNFRAYRPDTKNQNSIPNNFVQLIFTDDDGNLWIATIGGLCRYNLLKDGFDFFKMKDAAFNDIISTAGHGDSKLWISTQSGHVGLYDIKTGKTSELKLKPENSPTFNLQSSTLIFEDSHKQLWIGTRNQGLLKFNPKDESTTLIKTTNSIGLNSHVLSIAEDKNSNIWIGTYNGLGVFIRNENNTRWFGTDDKLPSEIKTGVIYSLFVDKAGFFWIGTQQNGLYKTRADAILKNEGTSSIVQHFTTGQHLNSLSNRSINSIFEDKDNSLWIGTYSGGINIIPSKSKSFVNLIDLISTDNLFPLKKFWGICQDTQGKLWLGSDGNGLYSWEKNAGKVEHFVHKPEAGNTISDNAILSALCDSEGELWFGTFSGGLNHFLKSSGTFERFVGDPKISPNFDIRRIFEDSEHKMWIGTNGNGLLEFDRKNKKYIAHPKANVSDVRAIAEMDGLWLGSYNEGLIHYDYKTGTVNRWLNKSENSNLNINYAILDILPDRKRGKIWIGTRYGGLNAFDIKSKTFKSYTENNGLVNNTVRALIFDGDENLWISTNNGISKFEPENERFINFSLEDGVLSGEFVDGAKFLLADGRICFGGAKGINIFSPSGIDVNKIPAQPTLFDVKIYNKSIRNFFLNKEILDTAKFAGFPKHINLDYDENFVAIDFGVINFFDANNIQYSYILDGLESKWNKAGIRRTAYYSNLAPGTYIFNVKSSYQGLSWSEPAQIKIVIAPPLWKRWWAYFFYFAVIFFLVITILKYYKRRLLLVHELNIARQNQELQKKVFLDKMVFYNNVSHELRTPLTLILSPLEEILVRTDLDTSLQKSLKLIYNNAKKLFSFINTLLTFSKAEEGSMKLHVSLHDVTAHVQNIVNSFLPYSKKCQVALSTDFSRDTIMLWYDLEKLEIILYNLISNAIKFSPKQSDVTVLVSEEKNTVIIEVRDTGQGIPAEKLPNLFRRFYRIGDVDSISGTGIGLALTKSLVELHKAEIEVFSELNKGTTFRMAFKNDAAVYSETELERSKEEQIHQLTIHTDLQEAVEETPSLTAPQNKAEKKHSILIVEDNHEMQQYLSDSFSQDYNVSMADNGLVALQLLESDKMPDIIISDIMMPEMDGLTFARKLKSQDATSHIPILLLTAKAGLDDTLAGLSAGAIDFISKPFNLEILKAKISGLIHETSIIRDYFRKKIFLEPSVSFAISNEDRILTKMKKIIEDNLTNSEFNVNTLVDKMAMSHSALYNKIKLFTDLTLNEFIRSCRIRRAGQLIADTDLSISEITYMVGLNDLKYFRECFKKEFGVTPTDYRKLKSNSEVVI